VSFELNTLIVLIMKLFVIIIDRLEYFAARGKDKAI